VTMDPALAAIIGGASGALITGGITIFTTLIHTNTEKQRHKKEIATQIALTEYNAAASIVQRRGGKLPPPQTYIVYSLKFMEDVNYNDPPEKIAKQLKAITKDSKQLTDLMKDNQSEY